MNEVGAGRDRATGGKGRDCQSKPPEGMRGRASQTNTARQALFADAHPNVGIGLLFSQILRDER